jgi:hypothetical protein
MYQGTTLNFGDQPERRSQEAPGPVVQASAGDVSAVSDDVADHETRIAALEALVVAMQAQLDDHEARIAALEP